MSIDSLSASSPCCGGSAVSSAQLVGLDVPRCLDSIANLVSIGGVTAEQAARFVGQLMPAYQAYLRKAASVSGGSSSDASASGDTSSLGETGASRLRARHVRKVGSVPSSLTIRRLGFNSAQVHETPGHCYLAAIREECRSQVASELGTYPTFFSLMSLPASRFRSESELRALRVTTQGSVCHVGSDGGNSFYEVFKGLAARSRPAVTSESVWHGLTAGVVSKGAFPELSPSMALGDSTASDHLVRFLGVKAGCISRLASRFASSSPLVVPGGVWLRAVVDTGRVWSTPSEWFIDSGVDTLVYRPRSGVVLCQYKERCVDDIYRVLSGMAAEFGVEVYLTDSPGGVWGLIGTPVECAALQREHGWQLSQVSEVGCLAHVALPFVELGGSGGCGVRGGANLLGYCYLAAFRANCRSRVALRLGSFPVLADIASCPVEWFQSSELLSGLRLSLRGDVLHLGDVGDFSFLSMLVAAGSAGVSAGVGSEVVAEFGRFAGCLSRDMADCLHARVGAATSSDGRFSGVEVVEAMRGATTLGEWFFALTGVEKSVPRDVEVLLTRSAAFHNADGKRRLKMYEALGDAALTVSVAVKCCLEGATAQEYQQLRSRVTSNSSLSILYGRVVPNGLVEYAPGVVPTRGNAGAYFIEAVMGYVCQSYGSDVVLVACRRMGLFDV